ncbi:MAG: zf-HC2 domain-containing protein [Chitinophagales bacterium]
MFCKDARELLSPYVDGFITEEEKVALENHLAGCMDCRQEMTELRSMLQLFGGLPELEVPSNFGEELHLRLLREKTVPSIKKEHTPHRTGWVAAAAAGIALACGIYASSLVPAPMIASVNDKIIAMFSPSDKDSNVDINNILNHIPKTDQSGKLNPAVTQPTPNTGNNSTKQVVPPTVQVATNSPKNNNNNSTGKTAAIEQKIATSFNLQLRTDNATDTINSIRQVALNNAGGVEVYNAETSISNTLVTLRVKPDQVNQVISELEKLGITTNPMKSSENLTSDYSKNKNSLDRVNAEVISLESRTNLTPAEEERLQARLWEQSYLNDKQAELEQQLDTVAIKILVPNKTDSN